MKGLTIVFDLDGTLVETAPDLIHATNHALAAARPRAGAARGDPPVHQLRRPRHDQEGPGLPRPRGLRWRVRDPVLASSSPTTPRTSPSAAICFRASRMRSISLAATRCRASRSAPTSRKACRASCSMRSGITERFAALAGRDTFPVCKPHPDHLLGAIRLAGGDARHAVMVGDSDVDIATAKAAGIPIVAVDFGYTDVPVADLCARCRSSAIIASWKEPSTASEPAPAAERIPFRAS